MDLITMFEFVCEVGSLGSRNLQAKLLIHRQSFHFDTPDRRTHRCKFNTARGPLDPSQQPNSISRRAGPRIA